MIETKSVVRPSVRKPHTPIKQSIMDRYETLLSKKPKKTTKGHRNKYRLANWTRDKNDLEKELLDWAFTDLAVYRYIEPGDDGMRYGAEGVTGSIATQNRRVDSYSILQKKKYDRWRGTERRKTLYARALKNKLHPRNKFFSFFGPKTRKHKGVAAGTRKRRKRRTRRGKNGY